MNKTDKTILLPQCNYKRTIRYKKWIPTFRKFSGSQQSTHEWCWNTCLTESCITSSICYFQTWNFMELILIWGFFFDYQQKFLDTLEISYTNFLNFSRNFLKISSRFWSKWSICSFWSYGFDLYKLINILVL